MKWHHGKLPQKRMKHLHRLKPSLLRDDIKFDRQRICNEIDKETKMLKNEANRRKNPLSTVLHATIVFKNLTTFGLYLHHFQAQEQSYPTFCLSKINFAPSDALHSNRQSSVYQAASFKLNAFLCL